MESPIVRRIIDRFAALLVEEIIAQETSVDINITDDVSLHAVAGLIRSTLPYALPFTSRCSGASLLSVSEAHAALEAGWPIIFPALVWAISLDGSVDRVPREASAHSRPPVTLE